MHGQVDVEPWAADGRYDAVGRDDEPLTAPAGTPCRGPVARPAVGPAREVCAAEPCSLPVPPDRSARGAGDGGRACPDAGRPPDAAPGVYD